MQHRRQPLLALVFVLGAIALWFAVARPSTAPWLDLPLRSDLQDHSPRQNPVKVEGTGARLENGMAWFDGGGGWLDVALPGLPDHFLVSAVICPSEWTNPYKGSAAIESVVSLSSTVSLALLPRAGGFLPRATLELDSGRVELAGTQAWKAAESHQMTVAYDGSQATLAVDNEVVATQAAHGRPKVYPGVPLRVGTWFKRNQAFCGAVKDVRVQGL